MSFYCFPQGTLREAKFELEPPTFKIKENISTQPKDIKHLIIK